MNEDLVQYTNDLFAEFNKNPSHDVPFPMGVFGTLRKNKSNSYLMGNEWLSHHYAFLPHFYAKGLGVYHNQGSSGVFEIFRYDDKSFKNMIPDVDALEGFSPNRKDRSYYYVRTLAKLKLLPEGFKHKLIDEVLLQEIRDFKIPENQWDEFPDVYCWIYSNATSNQSSLKAGNSPIVWS